jgi:hypothetical protein
MLPVIDPDGALTGVQATLWAATLVPVIAIQGSSGCAKPLAATISVPGAAISGLLRPSRVGPWLLLARDLGLTVKWLDFDPQTFEYRLDSLPSLVGPRTKLAAINYASNALGTINDVKAIAAAVHAAGGLVYVDAVQYVPMRRPTCRRSAANACSRSTSSSARIRAYSGAIRAA